MATAEIKTDALGTMVNGLGVKMVAQENIQNMFILVQKLSESSQLYDEFKLSPDKVIAREVPALMIEGAHFHTVDSKNNYYPPEGGAEAQIMEGQMNPDEPWVRIEIRTGVGPLCALLCGVCNGEV